MWDCSLKNSTTQNYSTVGKTLLLVKPGITDFSSIVFSDEGAILEDKDDPDLSYNQLIRPWKSRLGLIYIQKQTFLLDVQLIFYTVLAILSKENALAWVSRKLQELGVDKTVVVISRRQIELYPFPPPGTDKIVLER